VRSPEAWSSFREYLIIAHCLHHTAEIDAYLSGQRRRRCDKTSSNALTRRDDWIIESSGASLAD
jgi:hypothetical protein